MSVTFSKLVPQSLAPTLAGVGAGECGTSFTFSLENGSIYRHVAPVREVVQCQKRPGDLFHLLPSSSHLAMLQRFIGYIREELLGDQRNHASHLDNVLETMRTMNPNLNYCSHLRVCALKASTAQYTFGHTVWDSCRVILHLLQEVCYLICRLKKVKRRNHGSGYLLSRFREGREWLLFFSPFLRYPLLFLLLLNLLRHRLFAFCHGQGAYLN